jgi:hypothetical protein
MLHANLRELTQADVDKMVDEELFFHTMGEAPINWNVLADDVRAVIDRMRRKDIIDEVYDVYGMIDNAIKKYL